MITQTSQASSGAKGARPWESFTFIGGVWMPVVVLALDLYVGPRMSLLYVLAGRLYLPRMEFLYLVATAPVAALSTWHLLHRPPRSMLAAAASGALAAGGITALAFTILAAWRMGVLFPMWIVPAWTACI